MGFRASNGIMIMINRTECGKGASMMHFEAVFYKTFSVSSKEIKK